MLTYIENMKLITDWFPNFNNVLKLLLGSIYPIIKYFFFTCVVTFVGSCLRKKCVPFVSFSLFCPLMSWERTQFVPVALP